MIIDIYFTRIIGSESDVDIRKWAFICSWCIFSDNNNNKYRKWAQKLLWKTLGHFFSTFFRLRYQTSLVDLHLGSEIVRYGKFLILKNVYFWAKITKYSESKMQTNPVGSHHWSRLQKTSSHLSTWYGFYFKLGFRFWTLYRWRMITISNNSLLG